jgi:nitroimidazol reductase NimA-like FMN-containing flavoprotein (pyridoxamine 5'-phosphate oxidase superfamily)
MAHRDLSQGEIEEILMSERVVRIAFCAGRERYLVPLGYVWLDGFICFVSMEGRKTRMASVQPDVAFQVDTSAKTGVFEWRSVTGEGTVDAVTDPAEIARIRPALFGRFPDIPGWMSEEFASRDSAGLLRWFRIRPTLLTGRAGGVRPR